MSHDSNRTRIWFPMFSYFESSVDGIIPNEYNSIHEVCANIFSCIIYIKDCCMLTARRCWIDAHNQLSPLPKNLLTQNLSQNLQINMLSKNFNNLMSNSNKLFNGNVKLLTNTTTTTNTTSDDGADTQINDNEHNDNAGSSSKCYLSKPITREMKKEM